MRKIAVFASGNGSNFENIAKIFQPLILICNNKHAYVIERAKYLNVPYFIQKDENKILTILKENNIILIALAGYMKLLSKNFINSFNGTILNIHPSILPKYPGAHAIEKAYNADEKEFGITIHEVDYGMDTGPIKLQKFFFKEETDTLISITEKIHKLEHLYYSIVIQNYLQII